LPAAHFYAHIYCTGYIDPVVCVHPFCQVHPLTLQQKQKTVCVCEPNLLWYKIVMRNCVMTAR
jgi:hypothetical protein